MSRTRRSSAAAAAVVAILAAGCAPRPVLPARGPSLVETRESAAGMLHREYPDWATGIGPVPARVVGVLLPAQSRWGRSLEHIGAGLVRFPSAYEPADRGRVRSYQLYAKDLSPRIVWFPDPAAPEPGRAVRTLTGEVRSFPAARLTPGDPNPWGLGGEAHLAALEVAGGAGQALWSRYEVLVTGVEPLEGQPGYPASVVALMDGARATFDAFVEAEAPRIAALLQEETARVAEEPGVRPREHVTQALFPYWDDERRRLVVLFHRSVLRLTEYSMPCAFVYEGMPPAMKSFVVRHGWGVELGQRLELDADGLLVGLTSFEPALFRIPSNAPEPPDSVRSFPVVCPGSPGVRRP